MSVRRLVPRQIEDPVEVRAHDRVLGRADLHRAQALELLLGDGLGLSGEVRLGDALFDAVEIALIAVVFAELFLDRLELLAQDVLALVLAHLLFDLGVDALAHLEDLELAREEAQHLADALLDVERLEQLRLLFDRRVEVGGDQIGERAGRLDRVDERAGFARQLGHQLDDLLGDVAQAHGERFGLDVVLLGLVQARDARLEVGVLLSHALHAHAHEALQDQAVVARRVAQRFEHRNASRTGRCSRDGARCMNEHSCERASRSASPSRAQALSWVVALIARLTS